MNLKGATTLVTGGSSGIGKGIASALIDAGARVAITGRDKARLDSAANEIGAIAINADVSKELDVERTMATALSEFGHLDILVNNAGLGSFKPLLEMDLADFERTFATNVTGAMLMARAAARHFVERKEGHIINIGSTASHRGAPNGTAYYASKFALRGMTECWRQELRKHNIRVMLVNPSEVVTNFGAAAGFEQKANDSKLQAADIAHAVRSVLEMDSRGFTTEVTVFATNPVD
jgi:3-oxoacyl-[acyl-carrier protein] reductase